MKNLRNIFVTSVLLFLVMGTTPANAQLPAECSLSTASLACQIAIHGTNNDQAEVWRREQQQSNQGEAQRQWQIREDAVQARIAKYRSTPYYGTIAASHAEGSIGWGGGYKTASESTAQALQTCSGGNCQVIATFSNACAGIAQKNNSDDPKTLIIATAADEKNALVKTWDKCESRYGKNNCGLLNHAKALCVGYDYGQYEK